MLHVTSLVSLQQGNVKKIEKLMKIVNIEGKKFSYLLNDFRNFNEIFRKVEAYNNIKNHIKSGFDQIDHPLPQPLQS